MLSNLNYCYTNDTSFKFSIYLYSIYQGVAAFDRQKERGDSRQYENHRTWGNKPYLLGKNHSNSSRREDDESDKRSGQTNAGIWNAVIGLKKPASMHISLFSQSCCRVSIHCALGHVVHA
ncbi:hypothetical protein TNCV_2645631 [Trichonephila clavipes]|nr:hypothetical protein TNCV_2645631 [Trichonephila clavipes]